MKTGILKTERMLFGQIKQVFNLGLFVEKGEFGDEQTKHIILMLLFGGGKDS